MRNIDETCIGYMLLGYTVAALFTSTDDKGEPLDKRFDHDQVSDEWTSAARADVARFYHENESDLDEYTDERTLNPDGNGFLTKTNFSKSWECAGQDFWLSRNGHGTGFWDRFEVADEVRDRLQEAARDFGESCLFEGDCEVG